MGFGIWDLRPSPVIDGVLVGRSRHRHVPLHRPVVFVVESLARVGLRGRMQEPPGLEVLRVEQTSGFRDEVVSFQLSLQGFGLQALGLAQSLVTPLHHRVTQGKYNE